MEKATEGEVKEVSYWWLRPGSDEQVKKTSYYTKAGDQICGDDRRGSGTVIPSLDYEAT
jgi:hypothetical protein